MIKYFCDICGKEINLDKHELHRLFVPVNINGIILNNELEKQMCTTCATKWYEKFVEFYKENHKEE